MTRCERHASAGFTYVWMLLFVALLGAGAALALEVDSTLAQRGRERELLRIGHEYRAAIERYHEQAVQGGRKQYPPSLDDLLQDPRVPGIRRHLRRVYVDPMTGRAEWGLVRVAGGIAGIHSLSDRGTIKRDGFAPDDGAFKGETLVSRWVFAYPSDVLLQSAPGEPGPPALPPAARPASAAR